MHEIERTWKVGELARATGLTIRALHHYDDIGLLVPSRTGSGHRLYLRDDVERLYRVLALRSVGMSLDEIKAVLDDAGVGLLDTVRRHVAALERDIEQRRRLLDRLREMLGTLERSAAPTLDDLLGTVEAMTVVEATIEDVITRDPWEQAWEMSAPHVVVLKETGGERVVPIYIGEPEAAALVMQQRGMATFRPLSHDLTVSLLGAVDGRVERVVIERVEDNTFYATIIVKGAGEPREVDARPSDALNLAVRAGAPIHLASDLVDQAGLTSFPGTQGPDGDNGHPRWISASERRERARRPVYVVDEHSPPVLRRAAAEARALGHEAVGEAHLMLGILAGEDCPAASLLHRHAIALDAARDSAVAAPVIAHDPPPAGDAMRMTTGAMFAMTRASAQARTRGTLKIAPMHLLLALVISPDAAEALSLPRDQIEKLRAEARAALDA